MNDGILIRLSQPKTCTVCGDEAYSAALCMLHYRKRYKSAGIAIFTPTERRLIAQKYWRQKRRIRLAEYLRLERDGKCYNAPPAMRVIIAFATRSWADSEIAWLGKMERQGDA